MLSVPASAIRQRMLDARRDVDAALAASAALAAAARLVALPEWAAARRVLLYVAVRNELDARPLLDAAWQSGKDVFLPRCEASGNRMEAVPCAGMDDLVPGRFGIPEPRAACTPYEGALDLAVVPGVAFDRFGNRLGHGQGFYDRFLARPLVRNCLRVGYAYAFQVPDDESHRGAVPPAAPQACGEQKLARVLPERLPAHELDIPMHALCTDKEFLWI